MPSIHKTDQFGALPMASGNGSNRFRLLLQGHPTGRTLKGRTLLDQYRLEDRFVLFCGNDSLYQEALYIFLLDQELNIVDEIQLSQSTCTGSYHPIRRGNETIKFQFFDEGHWCLSIRNRPKGSPLNSDQYPVARPLKLWGRQYLNLERLNHSHHVA